MLATAGEALDEETAEWCHEYFGMRPLDAYGASEVGFVVCNYSFGDWEVKPGSMGKPLPGRGVALLDEDGDEVGPGGELLLFAIVIFLEHVLGQIRMNRVRTYSLDRT